MGVLFQGIDRHNWCENVETELFQMSAPVSPKSEVFTCGESNCEKAELILLTFLPELVIWYYISHNRCAKKKIWMQLPFGQCKWNYDLSISWCSCAYHATAPLLSWTPCLVGHRIDEYQLFESRIWLSQASGHLFFAHWTQFSLIFIGTPFFMSFLLTIQSVLPTWFFHKNFNALKYIDIAIKYSDIWRVKSVT